MVATGCVLLLSGCYFLNARDGASPNPDLDSSDRVRYGTTLGVRMPPRADTLVKLSDDTTALIVGPPPVKTPAPPVAAVPPPIAAAPALAPVTASASPESSTGREQAVSQVLDQWRQAWVSGDAARYFNHYDLKFKGGARTRASWEKQRREKLANGNISVVLEDIKTKVSVGEAEVTFTQRYSSNRHADIGVKQMRLRQAGGKWLIVTETWGSKQI